MTPKNFIFEGRFLNLTPTAWELSANLSIFIVVLKIYGNLKAKKCSELRRK